MKLKITCIIAVLLMPIVAQEAKILIVEKADSQKLAKAYKDYKDAAKRWEDLKAEVAKQYTYESGKAMPGWEKVEFSADFRAIVPKTSSLTLWPCSTSSNWCGISMPATIPYTNSSSSTLTNDFTVNPTLIVSEKK